MSRLASAKKKTATSAEDGGNRRETLITTPDMDETLAKRMKRKFSSRLGSSMYSETSQSVFSDLSVMQQSMLGASMASVTSERSLRERSRSKKQATTEEPPRSSPRKSPTPNKLSTATIDKVFKVPEESTARSSPTQFQRSKVSRSRRKEMEENVVDESFQSGPEELEGPAGEEHDEDTDGATPRRTRASPIKRKDKSPSGTKGRQETSGGSLEGNVDSNSVQENLTSEPGMASAGHHDTPTRTPRSSKKSLQSVPRLPQSPSISSLESAPETDRKHPTRSTESGRGRGGRSKGTGKTTRVPVRMGRQNAEGLSTGLSDPEAASSDATSDDGRRGAGRGRGALNERVKKAVQSSTDSEFSLVDQEFISCQTRLLSTPFSLEAGPGDWIKAWKRRARSEDDEEEEEIDIPDRVVKRAIAKVNKSMEALIQQKLSRAKQREVLRKLVSAREDETTRSAAAQAHLRLMEERLVSEPDLVLSNVPDTWTETDDSDATSGLHEKYEILRSHVSRLSNKLTEDRMELQQNQILLQTLEGVVALEPPNQAELMEELDRSRVLVTKVMEKLKQNKFKKASPYKKGSSTSSKPGWITLPNPHHELKNMLFDLTQTSS